MLVDPVTARALPDGRDGLRPPQRRILVATDDPKVRPLAQHRKCAKIAGDTAGNYHPHGEQVIDPTRVHMAQPPNGGKRWSMVRATSAQSTETLSMPRSLHRTRLMCHEPDHA